MVFKFKVLISLLIFFFSCLAYSNSCGIGDSEAVKEYSRGEVIVSLLVDRGWFGDDYYLVTCHPFGSSVAVISEEVYMSALEADSFEELDRIYIKARQPSNN